MALGRAYGSIAFGLLIYGPCVWAWALDLTTMELKLEGKGQMVFNNVGTSRRERSVYIA